MQDSLYIRERNNPSVPSDHQRKYLNLLQNKRRWWTSTWRHHLLGTECTIAGLCVCIFFVSVNSFYGKILYSVCCGSYFAISFHRVTLLICILLVSIHFVTCYSSVLYSTSDLTLRRIDLRSNQHTADSPCPKDATVNRCMTVF